MNNYTLIENDKNILSYSKTELNYLIYYKEKYNNKSNFIEIINNYQIFDLINQLNNDLIIDYKKNKQDYSYVFNMDGFDLIHKTCKINFDYEIKNINNNYKIIFKIKEQNDCNVEPNILKDIAINVQLKNNELEFHCFMNFKDDIEFFKRDIFLLIFKKVIYRLKNYTCL